MVKVSHWYCCMYWRWSSMSVVLLLQGNCTYTTCTRYCAFFCPCTCTCVNLPLCAEIWIKVLTTFSSVRYSVTEYMVWVKWPLMPCRHTCTCSCVLMKLLGWSTATLAYLHSLLLVLQVYNRVLGRVWLVVYIRMYKTVYVQVQLSHLLVCYLCQAILELCAN